MKMNEEVDEIEELDQESLENYEPLDENNNLDADLETKFEPLDENNNLDADLGTKFEPLDEVEDKQRKFKKILDIKEHKSKERIKGLSNNIDEQSKFDTTEFLDSKLLDLYREYLEKKNQKANIGTQIRLAFIDFIKDNRGLVLKEKRELLEKVDIINKKKLIEKYIIHKLKTTKETVTCIAKMQNIDGLWINHHYVRDKEKELGIDNRRVLRANVAHPNLNERCFKSIDTKEKGYWLGVMYSDGSTHVMKHTNSKSIELKTNLKDEILINKFIGFTTANLDKKYYKDNYVRIRINSKEMFNDLERHGCFPNKSLKIRFPKLPNREIELSFLLGCFDGDGTKGTSRLTSGSREFLVGIRNKFNIENKVTQDYVDINAYRLSLGVNLFNEMLDNYKDSLSRKRVYLTPNEKSIKLAREKAILAKKSHRLEENRKLLTTLTKEELKDLIWKIPQKHIAKKFGVLPKDIDKMCKSFKIEKPPIGYWRKHK